jgi:hypothetical protein
LWLQAASSASAGAGPALNGGNAGGKAAPQRGKRKASGGPAATHGAGAANSEPEGATHIKAIHSMYNMPPACWSGTFRKSAHMIL